MGRRQSRFDAWLDHRLNRALYFLALGVAALVLWLLTGWVDWGLAVVWVAVAICVAAWTFRRRDRSG